MGLTDRAFTINPFCLEPTPEHLHFLFSFVRVLLESSGQYRCTLTDDRDLYEAIENLYALDPPQRRLFTLVNLLPRPLGQHLHRWVQGGPYAGLFDNVEDTLTFQRVQCFDFEGLDQFPLVLEPLLFYVLHRASAAIRRRAPAPDSSSSCSMRRGASRATPTLTAYITEALKTWRKRNAADAPRHAQQRGLRNEPTSSARSSRVARPSSSSRIPAWTSSGRASCSISITPRRR